MCRFNGNSHFQNFENVIRKIKIMNSNYVYKIALLSISCVCVKLSLKNSVFVHVKQYRMVYNQWKHSSHDCCINRSMATLNAFDVIIGSKFIDRSQSILNCYLGFCGINSEDYWNVTGMLYDAASHMEFTLTISWLLKQQWICAYNTLLTLIASKQANRQASKFVGTNVTYSSYH